MSKASAWERRDEAASDTLVWPDEYTFSTAVDNESSELFDESMALDTEATAAVAEAASPPAPLRALACALVAEDFALPTPATSALVESIMANDEPAKDAYDCAESAAVRRRDATVCTRVSSADTVLTAVGDDRTSPMDEAVSSATSPSV